MGMNTLSRDIQAEQEFLHTYDASKWPHPSLTADICVFGATTLIEGAAFVLLVRRGGHPYKGCWALPGGFSEPGEEIEETAARELAEETGLFDVPLERTYLYSGPERDPRGWTASQAFVAMSNGGLEGRAGDDADQVAWFDLQAQRTSDHLALALTYGDISLSAQASIACEPYSCTPRAYNASGEGLAFDHARLLCDAFLYMEGTLTGILKGGPK